MLELSLAEKVGEKQRSGRIQGRLGNVGCWLQLDSKQISQSAVESQTGRGGFKGQVNLKAGESNTCACHDPYA